MGFDPGECLNEFVVFSFGFSGVIDQGAILKRRALNKVHDFFLLFNIKYSLIVPFQEVKREWLV